MKSFFRIIAFLEGVSYILLLFIAVPIKYFFGNEFLVQELGPPHGWLFILYVITAFLIKKKQRWRGKSFKIILFASLVPFGTFYVEKKYF
tara:strand:- start:293 stop:562 length:270 start_codon:yes stop_codon:yes gene_type:complete